MALLRGIENLRDRLGFDDIRDVNMALEIALETASITIADQIRTDFDRATVEDIFFVTNSYEFGTEAGAAIFKLTRGFLDSGEATTCRVASTYQALTEDNAYTDVMSPDNYTHWDYEKGVVRLQDYALENAYVRITYTAGFSTDGGDPATYLSVPSWLSHAAGLSAAVNLNANPVYRREGDGAEAQIKAFQEELGKILLAHIRYLPLAFKPRTATVTTI